MRTRHDADAASKQAEIDKLKRDNEILQNQVHSFDTLHKSMLERAEREEKLFQQREKSRTESIEREEASVERTHTLIKIGGTIAAGVLTFALAQLAKSSKK